MYNGCQHSRLTRPTATTTLASPSAPCSPTDKHCFLHASSTTALRRIAFPASMAAQHSRTRSDRVGAPAATPASRRPLSMHGRPPAPPTPSAVKAAPNTAIPTFLTNLRLLDLDLLEDWPDITTATFAGTTQNHKRRVQAVEWALYRLFEIWDPEDTASV